MNATLLPYDELARVCHEVNRAYCQAIGDMSQPTWEDAPEWQKISAWKGVQLHVDNPHAGVADSHNAWMKEKVDTGWHYGVTKDPENKLHPCIVPYEMLPLEQQAKDYIFRAIVHALTVLD